MKNFLRNGTALLWKKQTNILSAATVIMVTYGASALVGLFRDRLLASMFFGGREWQLDVYFAAFLVPDTIFQLLVIGALSAAFIPIFSQLITNNQRDDAWYVASASTTVLMSIFSVLAVVFCLLALPLSRLIAPGFSPIQWHLMADLMRIMIVAQIFFALSGFISAILQSHQRFLVPALAPILYNVGIIGGIVLLAPFLSRYGPTLGIYGPAIGVVIGSILHLLIQLIPAVRLGFSIRPIWDYRHPAVQEIGRLMVPRTLALGIDRIEQFVAVFLATTFASGSLSLFNFAQHIYLLPASLFGVAIGQASLPTLSEQAAKNPVLFRRTLIASVLNVVFLAFPAGVGILILRIPVVRIVFGAKSFPWPATILTGQIVALFAISIVAQALIQLLIRGFYALKNTSVPLYIGLVSAGINVCLSFYFTYGLGLGVRGLALSISLACLLEMVALLFFLERRSPGILGRELIIPLTKLTYATVFTGFVLWALMRSLDQLVFDTTKTLNLIILTVVVSVLGVVLYAGMAYLLKIEQLQAYWLILARFGKWRQVLSASEETLENPTVPSNPA
jgi:putative peptidoglycan lipid II flippase